MIQNYPGTPAGSGTNVKMNITFVEERGVLRARRQYKKEASGK